MTEDEGTCADFTTLAVDDAGQIDWTFSPEYSTVPGVGLYVDGYNLLNFEIAMTVNGTTAYALPEGSHTVEIKCGGKILACCSN